MISTYRRSPVAIAATLAALTLLIGACGDGGEQEAASSTATAQPREAAFPVILEHDTRVIAAADGSDISEEPVEYRPRVARQGTRSPDGRLIAGYRNGQLFVQQGDAEPEVIAEVASTEEFASIAWSPDSRRLAVKGPDGVRVLAADVRRRSRPGAGTKAGFDNVPLW